MRHYFNSKFVELMTYEAINKVIFVSNIDFLAKTAT